MSKYNVGDKFKLKQGKDTVKREIIFIPPLDSQGRQFYLTDGTSITWDGGKNNWYDLEEEKNIDKYFELRK